MQGGLENNPAADVQLVFYDENMRPWKFRYCYWKSSQSFVFTRGWNRFVKERLLKANDTVRFYECHNKESFYRITIDRAESSGGIVENANQCVSLSPITLHDKKFEEEIKPQVIDQVSQVNGGHGECRRIKLFGVYIVVDED
ncbi:hypothetical protein M0R45_002990 [Rubus argutus]|uniref:TF-B3 domain-containing protein n=1 Tax=Rubus argutus TaxID=59490 RepID=A0AAW1YG36_RUBAR